MPTNVSGVYEGSKLNGGSSRPLQARTLPRGTPDIERMFRTLKEEIVWTRESQSMGQLEKAFEEWI